MFIDPNREHHTGVGKVFQPRQGADVPMTLKFRTAGGCPGRAKVLSRHDVSASELVSLTEVKENYATGGNCATPTSHFCHPDMPLAERYAPLADLADQAVIATPHMLLQKTMVCAAHLSVSFPGVKQRALNELVYAVAGRRVLLRTFPILRRTSAWEHSQSDSWPFNRFGGLQQLLQLVNFYLDGTVYLLLAKHVRKLANDQCDIRQFINDLLSIGPVPPEVLQRDNQFRALLDRLVKLGLLAPFFQSCPVNCVMFIHHIPIGANAVFTQILALSRGSRAAASQTKSRS